MADTIKKGDIVRLNYTAEIAGEGKVYDTTSADIAKDAGIFNEKYAYTAMPYIIGSGRLFKVLDEAIAGAEVGKETVVEIKCQDAIGEKDPKLIQTYPIKEFHKQEIAPVPGLEIRLGDKAGVVLTVGAGRVKVDFNNFLAGKDLKYTFTVEEVIDDASAKTEAIVLQEFGTVEGFKFEVSDDKVVIHVSDLAKFNQNWMMSKFKIVAGVRESVGVKIVEFVETWDLSGADKE